MKKITILLLALFLVASCGTANNNQQEARNNTNPQNQQSAEDNNWGLDDEFLSNEDFKMHFSTKDEWQELEAIMQKKWKDMSIQILKMDATMMPQNIKMKAMIVKDDFFYTNMQIWDKNVWMKWPYDDEKREEAGFLDVKKLLKKIKQEGIKKETRDIDGKNYDCYDGKFLEATTLCFEWKNLKYILDDENQSSMKIIEFTDKIDSNAFKIPSDDEVMDQKDLAKMMMDIWQ